MPPQQPTGLDSAPVTPPASHTRLFIVVGVIVGLLIIAGGAYFAYAAGFFKMPAVQTGMNTETTSVPVEEVHGALFVRPAIAEPNYSQDPETARSVVSINSKTGERGTLTTFTLIQTHPARILSIAVNNHWLAYIAVDTSDKNISSEKQVCSVRVRNLQSGAETEAISITGCEQAHGPNYVLTGISSDGANLSMVGTSGEAGFGDYTVHSVTVASKQNSVVEKFSFKPVCTSGQSYDAQECTQAVKEENAKFEVFRQKYNVREEGFQCGLIITPSDINRTSLRVDAAGKTQVLEGVQFVGCF